MSAKLFFFANFWKLVFFSSSIHFVTTHPAKLDTKRKINWSFSWSSIENGVQCLRFNLNRGIFQQSTVVSASKKIFSSTNLFYSMKTHWLLLWSWSSSFTLVEEIFLGCVQIVVKNVSTDLIQSSQLPNGFRRLQLNWRQKNNNR